MRGFQAGDEMIVRILLNDVSCINAADSDGNTALHLCLRANITATKVSG
jgi:ankyrin repeat protein